MKENSNWLLPSVRRLYEIPALPDKKGAFEKKLIRTIWEKPNYVAVPESIEPGSIEALGIQHFNWTDENSIDFVYQLRKHEYLESEVRGTFNITLDKGAANFTNFQTTSTNVSPVGLVHFYTRPPGTKNSAQPDLADMLNALVDSKEVFVDPQTGDMYPYTTPFAIISFESKEKAKIQIFRMDYGVVRKNDNINLSKIAELDISTADPDDTQEISINTHNTQQQNEHESLAQAIQKIEDKVQKIIEQLKDKSLTQSDKSLLLDEQHRLAAAKTILLHSSLRLNGNNSKSPNKSGKIETSKPNGAPATTITK